MLTINVWLVMSFSKHQLSAALKRKCPRLDEKIVILYYANEHPKMGCWKIAEPFQLEKQLFRTFWKMLRTYDRTLSFSKVPIKSVVMESTMLSMKFCTIGMESARVQKYILTCSFFKKSYGDQKKTGQRRICWFYSFKWMVR